MDRKLILTALASAAILCGGQALAAGPGGGGGGGGPGGGGHGGGGDHGGGGMGDHGGGGMGNAGLGRGDTGDMDGGVNGMNRGDGRINSEGPEHASPNGIAHADDHSVLAGTTAATRVTSGALAGVADGQAVFFNGMQVGTVQQIRLAGNGNVAIVLVKAANGSVFPVPANKLTLANGVLSTTARFRGVDDNDMAEARMNRQNENEAHDVNDNAARMRMNRQNENEAENEARDLNDNDAEMRGRMNSQGPTHASATGIAHANGHSVLAGGAVTTTAGISVGMPLFANGAQVGTVTRVISEHGMVRRVLVQGLNGRTFSLSPSMLTASNGTLTTTARLRGM